MQRAKLRRRGEKERGRVHKPAARLQHYAEGEMTEERGEEKRAST